MRDEGRGSSRTSYSLLPTPYSLLPTPYSLLPTPYSLLPTPYSLLPSGGELTMWQHNYMPIGGSLALSTPVAAIPIVVLFVMLGVFRKAGWMSAAAGLASPLVG